MPYDAYDAYAPEPAVAAIFARFFGKNSEFRPGSNENEYAFMARHRCVQVHLLLHYLPGMDGETADRARRTLAALGGLIREEADRLRGLISETSRVLGAANKRTAGLAQRTLSTIGDDLADLEAVILATAVAQ
jgi:hypothetical protein